MKPEKINDLPIIFSDVFISLGIQCRPARWLKDFGLRKEAMPLDWMRDYKLQVVSDILLNKNISYFTDFSETFVENSPTRHIRCDKTQMECIHHFPMSVSAKEYLPTFLELFHRRLRRFRDVVKQTKNICFVMCRNDAISEIFSFISTLQQLYHNTNFILINVRYNKNSNYVEKYTIDKHITLYDYSCKDIHEKGIDHVRAWKGNTQIWTNLMKKLHFKTHIIKPKYYKR